MKNQLTPLEQQLDLFFDRNCNDLEKMQASCNLISLSQREDFLESALTLLLAEHFSENKVSLLSCMIKDRFRYDFELLNTQKIEDYYELLCSAAAKFGVKSKGIFSNISQSLALIYLNQIKFCDLSLGEYLKKFIFDDPSQPLELYNYYFKILEECPQVVHNSKIVVEEESRKSARTRLVSQQKEVIGILNASVQDIWSNPIVSPHVSKSRLIDCFQSWLDLKYNAQIYDNLPNTPLLHQIMVVLKEPNQELLSKAVYCLKTIIDHMRPPEENPQLYHYIGTQIYSLVPYIDMKMQANEMYIAEKLIDLVVFYCQKYRKAIVENYCPDFREFFLALIRYTTLESWKVVDDLISFWEDLLQMFVKVNQESQPVELQPEIGMSLLSAVRYRLKYLPKCIRYLESTPEHKLGNKCEEGGQIYTNRLNAQNLYQSLAEVMGNDSYLQFILIVIQRMKFCDLELFSELESWLNALIHGLKGYSQINGHMLRVVEIYENLSNKVKEIPVFLNRTFLKLFKIIFSLYTQDHNLVEKLYYATAKCFSNTVLLDTASRTFYAGCRQNPRFLNNYVYQILGLVKNHPYEDFVFRGFVCVACYDLKTAGFFISDALDFLLDHAHKQTASIDETIDTMQAVLKQASHYQFDAKKDLFIKFAENSWQFILRCLRTPKDFTDDRDRRIEQIVNLLKGMMRIMKSDLVAFLPQLFEIAIEGFEQYPICSYLYLVEIAVTVYSGNPSLKSFLCSLYDQFTKCAFNHLQSAIAINNYAYLVDDLLGMSSRLLLYNSSIIISSRHFPRLLEFISKGCNEATSNRILKANYSLLHELFKIFWIQDFVQAYKNDDDDDSDKEQRSQAKLYDNQQYLNLKAYLIGELPTILQRMIAQLSYVPTQGTKRQIINTIISSIKAFPEVNPSIWRTILQEMPSFILLQPEKNQIISTLQNIRKYLENQTRVKAEIEKMKKYFNLMNKRFEIAEKRMKLKTAN